MRLKVLILFAVIHATVLATIAFSVKAESTNTVAGLIDRAHKHDNMYTLGPSASQQKALRFYESALAVEPDEKQRLHILYRMAQLYGSSYDLSKGEKPNFRKAIELNKEIVESYPPEEPLVYKAISSICDHYTTLRDFESALEWAKKVLEHKPYEIAEQLESSEIDRKTADRIRRYQRIAVEQVAYTTDHISYLRTHGELRHISDKYHGTFIADRADELLVENMDKMSSLWAPTNDAPFSPSGPALQAAGSTPAAHSESQKDMQIQSNITPKVLEKWCSVEPNTTEIPQKDKHIAREPRAPPLSCLSKCIIGVAGLIILALAAVTIKKRKNPI